MTTITDAEFNAALDALEAHGVRVLHATDAPLTIVLPAHGAAALGIALTAAVGPDRAWQMLASVHPQPHAPSSVTRFDGWVITDPAEA